MDERRKQPRDTENFDAASAREQKTLTIERGSRTLSADILWSRDNVIGVSFREARSDDTRDSDLDERVRRSEMKKRELQEEIQRLLGK
ncbi:hypothetical protein RPMA_17275 [Tardiphaga alba]|uniref:Uncharacterized protein n=1 Tax=Tardiphaga alba TaxID=340268 RepID=A0ABX8ADC7_9BRAD|nr:hypothetical protein [Tardiphaga alba]QUS40390.1 hypothetical protein RPMA_17275 [Tardiphaga alba]